MSGIHNCQPLGVVRAFKREGWVIDRIHGSHYIMKKEGCCTLLSIPVHRKKPIKQGLLQKLVRAAGLTQDEFLKAYNA